MIALGFVYMAFSSHMSYIVIEKKADFYKERDFWLLTIGLSLAALLTQLMTYDYLI
mgnify:CR=1 FL=1